MINHDKEIKFPQTVPFEMTAFGAFAYPPRACTSRSAFKSRLGKKVPDRLHPTVSCSACNSTLATSWEKECPFRV